MSGKEEHTDDDGSSQYEDADDGEGDDVAPPPEHVGFDIDDDVVVNHRLGQFAQVLRLFLLGMGHVARRGGPRPPAHNPQQDDGGSDDDEEDSSEDEEDGHIQDRRFNVYTQVDNTTSTCSAPLLSVYKWVRLQSPIELQPRSGHVCALQAISRGHDILWVYGGYGHPHSAYVQLFSLDLLSFEWRSHRTRAHAPVSCLSQSAFVHNNKLHLFGGTGFPFGEVVSADIHVCDLSTFEWSVLPMEAPRPSARFGQAMVRATDGMFYMFSGTPRIQFLFDFWRFDPSSHRWSQLNTDGAPSPRYRHTATAHGNLILFVGGGTPHCEGPLDVVHSFDIISERWAEHRCTSAGTGFPRNRRCHTSHVVSEEGHAYLYMIGGGINNEDVLSDIWKLDLQTFEWHQVTSSLSLWPVPAMFHVAEITQSGLLVTFGGKSQENQVSRTNAICVLRMRIPTLQELCLHALFISSSRTKKTLEQMGVPPMLYKAHLEF